MRIFKFRTWDNESKVMRHDFMLYSNGNHSLPEFCSELMQFTGLLDNNGKEVYEGDIYITLYPNGEWGSPQIVTWNNETGGFGLHSGSIREVIGNIFENSDFLNK